MKTASIAVIAMLAAPLQLASAQSTQWRTVTIPQTGTSVDLPSSIFSEGAGAPEQAYGERFQTADRRANLTVQATANDAGETPAAFLARMHPPQRIQYKRVTSRFFVVSSYKADTIWYDRCNFGGHFVHCVLINYPAREERSWDAIVTRISLSLTGEK